MERFQAGDASGPAEVLMTARATTSTALPEAVLEAERVLRAEAGETGEVKKIRGVVVGKRLLHVCLLWLSG